MDSKGTLKVRFMLQLFETACPIIATPYMFLVFGFFYTVNRKVKHIEDNTSHILG